jgi:hypothetical protein
MHTQAGLVFKVFMISVGLSILIKYGGPILPIVPNRTIALIAISFPMLVIALALWWRSQNNESFQ